MSSSNSPAPPPQSVVAIKARLLDVFGEDVLGAGKEDSMAECVSLSRLYSLDPQDLYYKFEAYALSSLPQESRSNPSLADFQALRKTLQTSGTDSGNSAVHQTPRRDGLFGGAGSGSASRGKVGLGNLFGTPAAQRGTPSRAGGTAFGRSRDGMDIDADTDSPGRRGDTNSTATTSLPWQVKSTLNSTLPAPIPSSGTTSRVKLAQGRDPNSYPSRYMFERRGERGEALDDQLDSVTSLLIETYGLSEEDISDPSIVSQESVYAVGRICPNAGALGTSKDTTGYPRLQPIAGGIMLEASKLVGAGQRVPLWFTKECVLRRPPGEEGDAGGAAELLGLFPGMLVGVKGRNGGGEGFGVEEVLLPPAFPHAATAPSELLAAQYGPDQLNGGALDIVVASGPFTSDDDLEFRPFHELMDNVERERPDALVLIGPFLPITHAKLHTSTHLPSELFQMHIAKRLNHLAPTAKSRTSVILVPSVDDALSTHAAFPQPAYDRQELGLAKGTRVLPNPAVFSISGIILGASSVDVLRDLRGEEVVVRLAKKDGGATGSTPSEDVVARAVRHVLTQRSFYPVFPPPQPKSSPNEAPLPLSLPHIHLSSFSSITPDVLLLPSGANTSIAPFAKNVDGVVIVNPGPVGASNVARLSIRPVPREELQKYIDAGDEAREAGVWERCRVDLLAL